MILDKLLFVANCFVYCFQENIVNRKAYSHLVGIVILATTALKASHQLHQVTTVVLQDTSALVGWKHLSLVLQERTRYDD